ncbi:hypothetical protein [Nostoc sp.]|uniref:hypothetical protein n=1 Tax=Nostoc sp. TaxID=1180 RepID=UPI002FFB28D4
MTNMMFNKTLAVSLYDSDDLFPIDLDDAWQWIGWSKKQTASDTLKSNFIEGEDFLRTGIKSTGGRPSEVLLLSVECFKMLGMIAGTQQGKTIRKYFIECERIAKEKRDCPSVQYLSLPTLSDIDVQIKALTEKESKLLIQLNAVKSEYNSVRLERAQLVIQKTKDAVKENAEALKVVSEVETEERGDEDIYERLMRNSSHK